MHGWIYVDGRLRMKTERSLRQGRNGEQEEKSTVVSKRDSPKCE